MKLKNILIALGGFITGVSATLLIFKKFLEFITKSDIMLDAFKNAVCDFVETMFFGTTREYRKKRKEYADYYVNYRNRYKYKPRYAYTFSDFKREQEDKESEEFDT